jgi:hypothetical protein
MFLGRVRAYYADIARPLFYIVSPYFGDIVCGFHGYIPLFFVSAMQLQP